MQCAVDANQRRQHHGKRKRGNEGSGVAKLMGGRAERKRQEAAGESHSTGYHSQA